MIRYSGGKGDYAGKFTFMLNLICVSSNSPGSGHAHTESTYPVGLPRFSLLFPVAELDWTPSSCTHSFLFLSFIFLLDFLGSMEMEPTFLPVLMDFALK